MKTYPYDNPTFPWERDPETTPKANAFGWTVDSARRFVRNLGIATEDGVSCHRAITNVDKYTNTLSPRDFDHMKPTDIARSAGLPASPFGQEIRPCLTCGLGLGDLPSRTRYHLTCRPSAQKSRTIVVVTELCRCGCGGALPETSGSGRRALYLDATHKKRAVRKRQKASH